MENKLNFFLVSRIELFLNSKKELKKSFSTSEVFDLKKEEEKEKRLVRQNDFMN